MLAYEKIKPWEGVVLVHNTKIISRSRQGYFKVKQAKNIENIHFFINFKLVSGAVIY